MKKRLSRKFYQQDLQLQTNYSDGKISIDQIVRSSIKNGRKIIGITDHAIGWDEGDEHCTFFRTKQEFTHYLDDINAARQRYAAEGVTVLVGLEVEIGLDGKMALGEGIIQTIGSEDHLSEYLDYIIGVIHSESFTVSLQQLNKKQTESTAAALLIKNIQALIANPQVLIWGHPFQPIHGHFIRNFNPHESQIILNSLQARQTPLLLEYNLNPLPHYTEWGGKSTYYVNHELLPNDMEFFEACGRIGSKFVVSTDAHDSDQTARLTKQTIIPHTILDNLVYIR